MFSRARITIVLTILLTLIPSLTVLAKGGFSFVAITGSNLKDTLRSSDIALTEDFFAFADFYRNKTEAPANPGKAYEITRYYVDGNRERAFDRLHYYPDTGFVFYDGIVNGSSEYDGKWYTAKPGIEVTFKKAISNHIQAAGSVADQAQVDTSNPTVQSSTVVTPSRTALLFIGTAGLVILLMIGLGFRRLTLTN